MLLTKTLSKRCFGTNTITRVSILDVPYSKIADHTSDDALEIIEKAYSENGLGTLAISGVPDYSKKRKNALL
jgi:hypothetical protein